MRLLPAFALLLALAAPLARADAVDPVKDLPGSADPAWLKRFEGSVIVNYDHRDFDAVSLPASPLVLKPGTSDAHNNTLAEPRRSVTAEGEVTRLLYVVPGGHSTLEVMRGYVDTIRAAGGRSLFGCTGGTGGCGGALRGSDDGGGDQGLLMRLYPETIAKAPTLGTADCADDGMTDQRYLLARLPDGAGGLRTLAVMAWTVAGNGNYCAAINGRTAVLVTAIAPKARQDRMVTVTAGDMAKALAAEGRIALYGLYFDTNKSTVKDASRPTLEQIATLLKDAPALKLQVVGHTDNVGDAAANLKLSTRRADAVVAALVEDFGIDEARLQAAGAGMTKPIADNGSEAGRAKNRRVELVKR
ncbi:OmpA family protein [Lysobacter xanthus]